MTPPRPVLMASTPTPSNAVTQAAPPSCHGQRALHWWEPERPGGIAHPPPGPSTPGALKVRFRLKVLCRVRLGPGCPSHARTWVRGPVAHPHSVRPSGLRIQAEVLSLTGASLMPPHLRNRSVRSGALTRHSHCSISRCGFISERAPLDLESLPFLFLGILHASFNPQPTPPLPSSLPCRLGKPRPIRQACLPRFAGGPSGTGLGVPRPPGLQSLRVGGIPGLRSHHLGRTTAVSAVRRHLLSS